MQHRAPTNPELAGTIGFLKRKGRQTQTPLWTAVADCLGKSRRSRVVLNLGQVSRHASEGDTVVVPGKLFTAQNGRRPHTAKVVGSNPSRPTINELDRRARQWSASTPFQSNY